jgi:hypothetical protein
MSLVMLPMARTSAMFCCLMGIPLSSATTQLAAVTVLVSDCAENAAKANAIAIKNLIYLIMDWIASMISVPI